MFRLVFLVTCLFLTACANQTNNSKLDSGGDSASSKSLKKLFDQYFDERMQWYPFEATQNGVNQYNDLFPIDISDVYRDSLKGFYQKYREALKQADTSRISENDRISYRILEWETGQNLAGFQFHDNYMPINQFWGKTLDLAQLGSGDGVQPFKTIDDYEKWLNRIHQFPVWADTAIANMRKGIKTGWVLPKSLAKKVLPELTSMIGPDVTKNIFYGSVKKLDANTSIPWDDKVKLKKLLNASIENDVIYPYKKLYDFLKNEYLPKCRSTSGVGALPGGDAYYRYLVKTWTTTDLTPEEIFTTGQQEVARIRGEMEKVKATVGFKGDLKSFFAFVNKDTLFYPYKKPADVLADFESIHQRIEINIRNLYSVFPKTKFEIKRTEEFREASASAEYNQGAPDGSRPGVFYIPIPKGDATKINNFQNEALFLHEAIPGHHFQTSLQLENTLLPDFRRFLWYGAYGEGYALYCESLGKELGLYTNPYQYFGRLGMEMHRAIRLVADVGIHTKGWTREQAIQYDLENESDSEDGITAEVERYMAIPGQALSYKTGELKIQALKKKALAEMGEKMDIRKFHAELLKDGCVPLNILDEKINRFILQK